MSPRARLNVALLIWMIVIIAREHLNQHVIGVLMGFAIVLMVTVLLPSSKRKQNLFKRNKQS